jgi:hypothetical protein
VASKLHQKEVALRSVAAKGLVAVGVVGFAPILTENLTDRGAAVVAKSAMFQ